MGFLDYMFKVSYVKLFLGLTLTVYESFINNLYGKKVIQVDALNVTQIENFQQKSGETALSLFSLLPDLIQGTVDVITKLANFLRDLLYNTVFSFKKLVEIELIQFFGQEKYNTIVNVPFVHNFLNVLTLFDLLTTLVVIFLIYQLARGQTYI